MERNLARFIRKEVSSEYREEFDSSTSTTDTPTQTRRIRADTSSISIIFLKAEKGNKSDVVRNGHYRHICRRVPVWFGSSTKRKLKRRYIGISEPRILKKKKQALPPTMYLLLLQLYP